MFFLLFSERDYVELIVNYSFHLWQNSPVKPFRPRDFVLGGFKITVHFLSKYRTIQIINFMLGKLQ